MSFDDDRMNPEVLKYCYTSGCCTILQASNVSRFCLACLEDFERQVPKFPSYERKGPAHYQTDSGMEAIDVIEAFKLGYNLSSALKYILRADKKGERMADLDKALNFLWRERYSVWRP